MRSSIPTVSLAGIDVARSRFEDTLDRLENENRVAFRYCSADGETTDEANPNGSARNIAGIYNEDFSVLGLMPHPERLADPQLGGTDGKAMFSSLVEALQ